MRFRSRICGTAAVLLCVSGLVCAQEVRVAAAADMKIAAQEIARQFEEKTGRKVDVTFGSSGSFFSQLQSGAPFDLFLSADAEYPKRLDSAGLGEPDTLYIYALGRIAIWMPADAPMDLARKGWDALLDVSVQKIAIANPEHAPYGRAAVAALQGAGIYERVRAKLVFGENISQAAQFVQSGNAQAGLLAMSLLVSPAMARGKIWEIPSGSYPPIEQAAIVMKNARNQESAKQLLDFLKSPAAKKILVKNGFRLQGAGTVGTVIQ